jgi:hypothetical protein
MATKASTQPGTATAPTPTVEGTSTVFDGLTDSPELDTLLADGFATPAAAPADRASSPKPVDPAKPKPAEASPDLDNTAEDADLSEPSDLSALVETDVDEHDDDTPGDDDKEQEDPATDDESHPESSKLPKWAKERMSKISAKKNEYKAQAEAAQAEAAALKAEREAMLANRIVAAPTPADPLADVMDAATLDQRLAAAKAALDWCDENVEGGEYQMNGQTYELGMKEVAQRRRYFERLVNEHGPKRQQWLQARQEAVEVAKQSYAALYQDGTRMARVREHMLRNIPGLASTPDADVFIGDAVIGAMVRSGQLRAFKAGAKPAAAEAAKPAPRSVPRATATAAPSPAAPRERARRCSSSSKGGCMSR